MSRMKKSLMGGLALLLLVGILGGAYVFFFMEEKKTPRPPRDLTGVIVEPVAVPLRGQQFTVPEQPETQVTLDLVAPTAKRDYPMGRFSVATGTGEGSLTAFDDLVTPLEGGRRAVPVLVRTGGTGEFYYLAILEDDGQGSLRHVNSVFLGDRLKVTSLTTAGSLVTVNYLVHAREQAFTEIPSVATSAVIDMGTAAVVQEGRKPWLEEVLVTKELRGVYQWEKTVHADGTEVVPTNPEAFTLTFAVTRISLGTDCNTGSAEFTPPTGSSTALTFGPIASTKMFCESVEEGPYFAMVAQVTAFTELADGDLTLTLADGSTMYFTTTEPALEFEAADPESEVTTSEE